MNRIVINGQSFEVQGKNISVNVKIKGNVIGDVEAHNVECGNVGGNVKAHNVDCGNVTGNVTAKNVSKN